MFTRYGIFNKAELRCRADISLENYSKIVHIEALTLGEMVKRDVMPAISKSVKDCCKTLEIKTRILGGDNLKAEKAIIKTLSDCYENLFDLVTKLDLEVEKAQAEADILKQSGLYNKSVLMLMEEIRAEADKAETLVPRENWPYPTYGDLLFNV